MAVKSADWLNAIPAALLLEQRDRIVFANTAAADLAGYPADDLAGMRIADLLEPMGISETVAQIKCQSGSQITVTLTRADVDHEGKPAQLITLQPTKTSVARAAIEGSNDYFYLFQCLRDDTGSITDLICIDANPRGLSQSLLPPDQLIGSSLRQMMASQRQPALYDRLISVVEQGQVYHSELHNYQNTSKTGWLYSEVIPLGDQVAIFQRDITPRKETEAAVEQLAAEVEQQMRLLDEILAATPDAFILFDRAGHYLYVNQQGLSELRLDDRAGHGQDVARTRLPGGSGAGLRPAAQAGL